MIERVVGPFRGGQGLLQSPEKRFRAQRHLHHAFWSHGAGNINLPPWWKIFLQEHEPDGSGTTQDGGRASGGVAAGLQELLLEFLYPVQTHALIRRLNRATRLHQQAAQVAKRGSREFTSIAEDLITGKTRVRHAAQNQRRAQSGDTKLQKQSDARSQAAEILMKNLNHEEKYDKLWKFQQDSFEAAKPFEAGILKEIFFLLSTSKRKIDLERSLALFETLPSKSPVLYNRAIKAALGLEDWQTAVDIHFKAAAVNPSSADIGTSHILSYAVRHGRWKQAIDAWYRLWQSKLLYYTTQRALWEEVDAIPLPQLLLKTEEATDFALLAAENTSSSDGSGPSHEAVTAARDFALSIAERAFAIKGVPFRQDQYIRLLDKIITLSDSSTKIRLQALAQLLSLKDRERFPRELARREKGFLLAAIGVFQELRQDADFVPPRYLLEELFTGVKELKNCEVTLMILEDWRKHVDTKLHISYYINMAKIAGASGEVAAVDQVFDNFIQDYPAEAYMDVDLERGSENARVKMMNLYLWVYFKRADTASIVAKFDELQRQHGITPNTASYNLIIMTYARVDDLDGAMVWFKSLQDSDLAPNWYTYNSLMSMYAKRGDLEIVQNLWHEVGRNGIKPRISMIDALVVANVKDERLKEAEELVEQAVEMDLEGSRTHMWNVLLHEYGVQRDLESLSRLHTRMHKLGVTEDSSTYVALLHGFIRTGNIGPATVILNEVMPKLRIPRNVMHYATIMAGCIKNHDYIRVFRLYRDMLKHKIVPDTTVNNALLRAAVWSDEQDSNAQDAERTEMVRAREVLNLILKSLNPAELASTGPRDFFGQTPVDQALVASYYGYMIHLYGVKKSFAKANELYDEYIAAAQHAGKENIANDPPENMLRALLATYRVAGNDEEVERCWHLALEKYGKMARRSNASLIEPGWVLPDRRFIINRLLREYLKYLDDRGRFDDMISTIKDLRHAGYQLYEATWNFYVSLLARSDNPKHCYLAFEICENELMQEWPGWERLARRTPSDEGRRWNIKHTLEGDNLGPKNKRMPRYKTLVVLAGTYADSRHGSRVSEDNVSRQRLRELAPITIDAVTSLPRIQDTYQDTYLTSLSKISA